MSTVFVSDAVGAERIAFTSRPPEPDRESRRWKALSALYQGGLAAAGLGVQPLLRPEIYQSEVARAVRGVRPGDWHLAVKPPEHLRPFHGVPNVFVCDRPPEDRPADRSASPFADPLRMLGLAQAVVCCTAAATRRLRSAGVLRAVYLPPPVPVPDVRLTSDRHRPPTVLAVVEEDEPAALRSVLQGFAMARAEVSDLRLLLHSSGAPELAAEAGRLTLPAGVEAGGGDLERALSEADAVLCASPPGAWSHPKVQAMLAGLPLLSPEPAEGDLPGPGMLLPVAIGQEADGAAGIPTEAGVRDALLALVRMDALARRQLGAAGREAAARRFGQAAFEAGLREIDTILRAAT